MCNKPLHFKVHPLLILPRRKRCERHCCSGNPTINHVRPLLQHVSSRSRVFGFVVNCPHPFLLMRETFLYPVRWIPCLMQQRASRPPHVMDGKVLKCLPLRLCHFYGCGDNTVEGCIRQRFVDAIAPSK